MRNRYSFVALSFASLSLVSFNALADEAPAPAPAAPVVAPAPAPAPADSTVRPQAGDDETPVAAAPPAAPAAAPAPAAPAYDPNAYAPPPPPAAAAAQVEQTVGPHRDGFTIGFAIGPGTLSVDGDSVNADTTVGMSIRLGAALTPNFLLQGDLEFTRAEASDKSAAQLNFIGVSGTAYLHPRFYLTGGLGSAELVVVDSNNEQIGHSDSELGVMLGLGIEAYQSTSFALSIELRGLATQFNGKDVSGGNVLLGFQWF